MWIYCHFCWVALNHPSSYLLKVLATAVINWVQRAVNQQVGFVYMTLTWHRMLTGPSQVRIYGKVGHQFEENYFLSDGNFRHFFRFFRWRRPKHKQISRAGSFQCKYLTLERVSPPHAEPGYYKKNDYGIRLESILRVVRKTTPVRRTLTVISALAVYAVDKNPSVNVTGSAGRERVLGLRDHHLGAVWTESYRAPIDDSQTGKRSQI